MRKLLASLFIGSIAIFAWAQQPRTTLRADVVVVGSGIAGMVSALSASEMNASVIILEKMPIIGGNTRLSTGLFNAPDPARQKPQNIEDSVEWFYKQTFEAGHSIAKPRLVRRMVENAYPSMKWLESYGIAYKQEVIQLYGGLWPRTHNPSISHGRAYIALLSKACETRNIPIMTEMKVEELLRQKNGDKRVYGVMAKGKTGMVRVLANKAVILATGGFTANKKMCEDLNPVLKGLPYTGAASATGEMLEIATRIGANLRDMKEIQINLGSQLGHKFRNGYHIDIAHHLLVNLNGERFVNEDGTRDKLGNAILRQPKKTVFSIIDYNGFQHMNSLFQQASAMSERRGTVYEGRTIAELAEKVGVDPKRFVATVDIYNKAVDTKKDPWGREPHMLVHKIDTPPFYAAKVIPAIHYTMGGIEIDENARVIDRQGRPIDGLFAAGEVTAGVHGANRIGGNAILDAVVFGRIAGRVAMGSNL